MSGLQPRVAAPKTLRDVQTKDGGGSFFVLSQVMDRLGRPDTTSDTVSAGETFKLPLQTHRPINLVRTQKTPLF